MWQQRRFLPRYGPYGQQWRMRTLYPRVIKTAAAAGSYYAGKAFKASPKQMRAKQAVNKSILRRAPRKSFPKKVGDQIKELKRLTEADMGTHIYRLLNTTVRSCNVAQASITSLSGMTKANLEAALANLRYYDPSAPSALVTADGTTGTYQKEFLINKMYSRYTVRNNYQVPAKVTMYIVCPKDATQITPQTAFTNGLADIGNPSSTSPMIHLTDSNQFNDIWRIESSKSKTLYPGQEMVVSYSPKPFQYDPSTFDSHTLDYNKSFRSYTLVIRVEGVLGHDTVAAEYTSLAASVDLEEYRLIEVKYSAGADIKTISLVDNRNSAFTNAGVVSNNPVVDNQSYSVN